MITYEVTATLRDDLRSRYEVFMRERHIPDVLLTGLFSSTALAQQGQINGVVTDVSGGVEMVENCRFEFPMGRKA